MIPQQITESTAQFLVRDGGFNLTRRESPPEAIANMLTYWLDGMKGGMGEGSCETANAAAAAGAERGAKVKVDGGSALQQHQQEMQQMQQELHEQHDHQQGSLSCAS